MVYSCYYSCTTSASAKLYHNTIVYSTSIVYAGAATATPTTVHRDQHQLQTDGLLHPRFARAACIFLPFHQGKGNSLSSGRRFVNKTIEFEKKAVAQFTFCYYKSYVENLLWMTENIINAHAKAVIND